MSRQVLGRSGEDLVARWYEDHGYVIVERNWRCNQGEIDIVASIGSTIVFCEVKTRSSERFGTPVEAVTRTKQMRLRRLGAAWLAARATKFVPHIRFDVAAVMGGDVQVVFEAF